MELGIEEDVFGTYSKYKLEQRFPFSEEILCFLVFKLQEQLVRNDNNLQYMDRAAT